MNRIPFNVYDWFGYLAPGIVLLLIIADAAEIDIGQPTSLGEIWTAAICLIAIYIAGHINAHISQVFLERVLDRLIKSTATRLLFIGNPPIWRFILPAYSSPLPKNQIERILEKFEGQEREDPELIYSIAFNSVKDLSNTKWRLDIFIALYGLHRNMSFVLIILFIYFFLNGWPEEYLVINQPISFFSLLLCTYFVFLRYLKFRRLFVKEVFLTFAISQQGDDGG